MRVDICHRLIKQMIEKGETFVCDNGYGYYNVTPRFIPKGLYSTRTYTTGEIVRKLEGKLVLNPTRESIHIGNGMHIIDNYGQYINHSFEPNIRIEFNNMVATRNIEQNEELTINYNDTEINMGEPFEVDGIKVSAKYSLK